MTDYHCQRCGEHHDVPTPPCPECGVPHLGQVGSLGHVEMANGEVVPNPIGMSLQLDDGTLMQGILADPVFQARSDAIIAAADAAHPGDPVGRLVYLQGHSPFADEPSDADLTFVEGVGRALVTKAARAALRLAGLDILDRPLEVEPLYPSASHVATTWHVVAAIGRLEEVTKDAP